MAQPGNSFWTRFWGAGGGVCLHSLLPHGMEGRVSLLWSEDKGAASPRPPLNGAEDGVLLPPTHPEQARCRSEAPPGVSALGRGSTWLSSPRQGKNPRVEGQKGTEEAHRVCSQPAVCGPRLDQSPPGEQPHPKRGHGRWRWLLGGGGQPCAQGLWTCEQREQTRLPGDLTNSLWFAVSVPCASWSSDTHVPRGCVGQGRAGYFPTPGARHFRLSHARGRGAPFPALLLFERVSATSGAGTGAVRTRGGGQGLSSEPTDRARTDTTGDVRGGRTSSDEPRLRPTHGGTIQLSLARLPVPSGRRLPPGAVRAGDFVHLGGVSKNILPASSNASRVFLGCLRPLGPHDKVPHRGRLQQQTRVSRGSGGCKSHAKLWRGLVCGEGPPPRSQAATLASRGLTVFPPSTCIESERDVLVPLPLLLRPPIRASP